MLECVMNPTGLSMRFGKSSLHALFSHTNEMQLLIYKTFFPIFLRTRKLKEATDPLSYNLNEGVLTELGLKRKKERAGGTQNEEK